MSRKDNLDNLFSHIYMRQHPRTVPVHRTPGNWLAQVDPVGPAPFARVIPETR